MKHNELQTRSHKNINEVMTEQTTECTNELNNEVHTTNILKVEVEQRCTQGTQYKEATKLKMIVFKADQ